MMGRHAVLDYVCTNFIRIMCFVKWQRQCNLAYFLTCHSPEIKRLIDGREVNTDLLGDPYVVFFGQVQGGLCGILRTAAKKLVEFICCGCQIF